MKCGSLDPQKEKSFVYYFLYNLPKIAELKNQLPEVKI
jgi:hypothetical protein